MSICGTLEDVAVAPLSGRLADLTLKARITAVRRSTGSRSLPCSVMYMAAVERASTSSKMALTVSLMLPCVSRKRVLTR